VTPLPFRLPPPEAVLGRTRAAALSALVGAGWRPWAVPFDLDAGRRRLLNVDLTEPELSFPDAEGGLLAVVHLEADRQGLVVLLEVTAALPAPAQALAEALFADPGDPRVGGGTAAREWVWGPEAGHPLEVGGEPARLWVCAERAYGDRLWAVLSLVRRAG